MNKKNKRWKFIPKKCPYCIRWLGTEKGMADHLKLKHGKK